MVDSPPERVTTFHSVPAINRRYELIDKSMASEKIPEVLTEDEAVFRDSDYAVVWHDDYPMYSSLYKFVSDPQPDEEVEVDFEYHELIEIDEVEPMKEVSYPVQKTQWAHEGLRNLNEKDIQHQLIDKIIFPSFVMHERPGKLSAKDTYEIIRQYVKSNINGKYATITSDYDFCFTVKKRINLTTPKSFTVDVNNSIFTKRKRKPKYETRYTRYRDIEIFNMTPSGYNNYRQVKEFQGGTQEELLQHIDNYCSALIDFINEPVIDCPHCEGRGVIIDETFPKDSPNE